MIFHTRLIIEDSGETDAIGREIFIVTQTFIYDISHNKQCSGLHIVVPQGYKTNFANTPRFFWRIFPPIGPYGKASVIHDYLCDCSNIPRQLADTLFYQVMKECGVPLWKRLCMYLAVRSYWLLWGKWTKKDYPYHIPDENERKLKNPH